MNVVYQEIKLETVLKYFVKDFEFKRNEVLFNWEAFLDPQKGKVIFKLYIQESK